MALVPFEEMNEYRMNYKGQVKQDIKIHFLQHLGFRDYIAARILFDRLYIIQGVTLASSAVEKYLKAYMVAVGKNPKFLHLNNLKELKKQLGVKHNEVLEKLDSNFLTILGKAYDLRYYENNNSTNQLGFLTSQVLAELDFTIHYLDSRVAFFEFGTNKPLETVYTYNFQKGTTDLVKNNYLALGIEKKEFMEKPSDLYSLNVDLSSYKYDNEYRATGIKFPYDGKIHFGKIVKKGSNH